MRILVVGGGSGGHVTPAVAVIREILKTDPSIEVRFWSDRKFAAQARRILEAAGLNMSLATVSAGKLRRYHNLPLWRQLLRPVSIVGPNLRDIFLTGIGIAQSFFRLSVWRPDVVFIKGGYVGLPVGLAAAWLRIPLVLHDSDVHPGLTNRILSRYATAIATGAPLSNYPYPKRKSHYTGIPIGEQFKPIDEKLRRAIKEDLGFSSDKPLVVITGGGLGARRINLATAKILPEILPIASVVLICGNDNYDEMRSLTPINDGRFRLQPFVHEGMDKLLGAADVVVARAGATTIQELAALAKPTILIPNAFLTGGHQLKNAKAYAADGSVIVVDESLMENDSAVLTAAITSLLGDEELRRRMSAKFSAYARPDAAQLVAGMVVAAGKANNGR